MGGAQQGAGSYVPLVLDGSEADARLLAHAAWQGG